MVSIFKRKKDDAFVAREKQQRVWRLVRRIIDTSSPMDLPGDEPARAFSRHMRCLPVLIVPMKGTEYFEHDEIMFAPTKDFSDLGLSFIANKPINTPEVLCGVWTDHPQLLHALVRRSKPFGGDLHEIGIEFTEVIESSQIVGLLKDDLARLNIDGHSG